MKKVLFSVILVLIPITFLWLVILSYYAYHKITNDSGTMPTIQVGSKSLSCGPFGKIDELLGWVLAPHVETCVGRVDTSSNVPYFASSIFTDNYGFRVGRAQKESRKGGIVAIGDSWTFGFAVHYEESYPSHLSEMMELPVANLGIPAYGSAQVLLLLERYVQQLKPQAVVFLNHGLWQRSICHGSAPPTDILKPCYWWNQESERLDLMTPPIGYVGTQASLGVFPGGYLTAGNSTWAYFLVSRPVLKIKQLLAKVGLLSGHVTEYDDDPFMKGKLTKFEVNKYATLARQHDFIFLLVDPPGHYEQAILELPQDLKMRVRHIGSDEWREEVVSRSRSLSPEDINVPLDGHYANGMNRIIASAVSRRLEPLIASPLD